MKVRPQTLYLTGLVLAGVILAAQGLGLALLPGAGQRVDFNSLVVLGCVLLATASAGYAAVQIRRHQPRLFAAWLVIAVGETLLIVGALADVIQASLPGTLTYPTAGDAFYLASYPLFLLFSFLLPAETSPRLEKIQWGFDAAIVALSTALLFWQFVIGPELVSRSGSPLQWLVLAAYSVGDLVMTWSLMTLVLRRFSQQRRRPLAWLLVAIGAQLFYDLYISLFGETLPAVAHSTPLELMVTVTQLAMMLACLRQAQMVIEAAGAAPRVRRPPGLLRLVIPYVWVLAAFLTLPLGEALGWAIHPAVAQVWVAVIVALVMVRQVLVMRDNQHLADQLHRLNAGLEAQVAVRSTELSTANANLNAANRRLLDNAAQLQSALEEVRRLNAELEQRVEARTAELSTRTAALRESEAELRALTEELEHRVEVRTAELSARTAQLNALNQTLAAEVIERQRVEAELRASEARFRTYIEHSSTAIFVADLAGRYVDVNAAACALSGYSRDELLRLGMFDMIPAEEVPAAQARLERGGGQFSGEVPLRRKDGTVITIIRDRVRLPNGHLLSFCTDITARKQAEEQIRRLNTELEQRVEARTAELRLAKEAAESANRAKSAFLSVMSHELRTPLNGIFLAAEMLREHGVVHPDQGQLSDVILASGRRLLNMVEGVMEYTASDIHLDLAPLDVAEALREVAVRYQPRAARKGLTLTFDVAAPLPPLCVDALRFDQMLRRLLDNAVRFTPEGGHIAVSVQGLACWAFAAGDKPAVRVAVTDTGPGLRRENLERVFEPFVQLEDSHLVHSEGAGLGLTLARRLAQAHGGSLTAESEGEGCGSTFILMLPVAQAA